MGFIGEVVASGGQGLGPCTPLARAAPDLHSFRVCVDGVYRSGKRAR
jgi:hypothetical protein